MENLAEIQSSDEYKMIMQSISVINDAISSLRKIFSYIHARKGIEGWQLTEFNFIKLNFISRLQTFCFFFCIIAIKIPQNVNSILLSNKY